MQWFLGGVVILGMILLGCGYYSFFLTTMVKRRSDEELYQLYPGVKEFYQQTVKTSQTLTSADGLKLFGELYSHKESTKKLVILVHGYKNNRLASLQYVPMFWQLGYDVLTIDQRGHGKSEGKLATYSHYERRDLALWIDQFEEQYEIIGLHGHSMGGATVLALSQRAQLAFVISEAGLTTAAQGVQTYVQNRLHMSDAIGKLMIALTNFYTLLIGKFSLYRTNPGKIAEQSDVPLLVIHGTADDSVPLWMSEDLIANKRQGYNRFWVIENGNHKDLYQKQPEEYQSVVTNFLQHISIY